MVPNIMHIKKKPVRLTGRQRYRLQKRWFKSPLQVLQVEEEYLHLTLIGMTETSEKLKRWRDWRLEDDVFQYYQPTNP